MKKTIIIILIVLSYAFSIFIGIVFGTLFDKEHDVIPSEVFLSKISPDSSTVALILRGNDCTFLFGNRYYLALDKNNNRWIVDRELSDGFGDYEGGIVKIIWLDSNKVKIERYISDMKSDIVFDISNSKWITENAF